MSNKIKTNYENYPGTWDAKTIFILFLHTEDAPNFTNYIYEIMKAIKKEQRTFENIVDILNQVYNENINNCQSFLTIEKINEVINACSDFIEDNDEI